MFVKSVLPAAIYESPVPAATAKLIVFDVIVPAVNLLTARESIFAFVIIASFIWAVLEINSLVDAELAAILSTNILFPPLPPNT